MITTKEEALRVLEDFLHPTKKVVKSVVKTSNVTDDDEEIDIFGYDTDEDDEEIDIFGYKSVVDAQNVIIGDDLLEVYQSKGKLMVDLSMHGSDDREFGMTAEICSAAGVTLVDEDGVVISKIGVEDVDGVKDAAKFIVNGGFRYVKFLSAFEMEIYDRVDEDLHDSQISQSVINLGEERWDYRLERCIEAGGYVRSLEESLFYTTHAKSVRSEWKVLEMIVGESLDRAELAKKNSETRKKVLSVWDKVLVYFGKSFIAELEDAMSARGSY